jgi:neutral ceramidase
VRTAECTVFGAEECLTLAHAAQDGRVAALQQAYRQAEVQVLRAGPLCLAALPGECFVEYGLDIKRQAPGRAFVIALANGELQGYISTPDATGYEARLSLFTPESGARMVEAAVRLMQELPAC